MTNGNDGAQIASDQWPELLTLFGQIMARDTPGWAPGQAFEHLILRAFELDGAQVSWPYEVHIEGETVEQIDGALVAGHFYCLIECKDEKKPTAVGPLAKMRNQLLRRPAATIGLIFSTSGYTSPALILARYLASQTILLWHPEEVQLALTSRSIVPLLAAKYHACVKDGVHDANVLDLKGIR